LFESINSPNRSAHSISLSKSLLELFSKSSSSHYKTRSKSKGRGSTPSGVLMKNPCVSFLGLSTLESLKRGLDVHNIHDGLLGRLFVMVGDDLLPLSSPVRTFCLPPLVKERADAIANVAAFGGGNGEEEVEVTFSEDGRLAHNGYKGKINQIRTDPNIPEEDRKLSARTLEKTIRIAGVLAIWDNPIEPKITAEMINWAWGFIEISNQNVTNVTDDLGDSKEYAAAMRAKQKVTQWLKDKSKLSRVKNGKRMKELGFISHSDFVRIVRVGKRDLENILAILIESRMLVNKKCVDPKTEENFGTAYYLVGFTNKR
jgi:hypothetical protein